MTTVNASLSAMQHGFPRHNTFYRRFPLVGCCMTTANASKSAVTLTQILYHLNSYWSDAAWQQLTLANQHGYPRRNTFYLRFPLVGCCMTTVNASQSAVILAVILYFLPKNSYWSAAAWHQLTLASQQSLSPKYRHSYWSRPAEQESYGPIPARKYKQISLSPQNLYYGHSYWSPRWTRIILANPATNTTKFENLSLTSGP